MRTAFVTTLCELAAADERILLLTADLGWSVLEKFATAYPDRFFNVGVAEQNMLGLATGLAREGYVPFVYSIATFASMRCYEQFRDGPVLHQLPVRVVGIGGGFSYGHAGPTHHALEDLTIGRTQPGALVLAPADNPQTRAALQAIAEVTSPVYLRLDKTDYPDLAALGGRFAFDQPELIRAGEDVLFLCTGSITHDAMRAAEALAARGVSAAVAVLAHLGFGAAPAVVELLSQFNKVITVEEGYTAGGLGSLIAEAIAQNGLRCLLQTQGVKTPCTGMAGSTEMLRRQHGLDTESLADVGEAMAASGPVRWRAAA